jgi:hypothetical protein
MTKFVFQAKIDVNRPRTETRPLRLKALLIALLIHHQSVDPTFHFLPTEDRSTAGAITKASDIIPNTKEHMKAYVKEMKDIDSRNSSQSLHGHFLHQNREFHDTRNYETG